MKEIEKRDENKQRLLQTRDTDTWVSAISLTQCQSRHLRRLEQKAPSWSLLIAALSGEFL